MPDKEVQAAGRLAAFGRDALASLVVFLVALPICMGIALASGAPIASGLITGIIGGIVVGMLAGAPLQVSGPAAGLTVICGEVIREHGLPALGIVVMIAGGLQIAAGVVKLGQWFRAVSPAVIHGMLSGIGILILTSQIHVMVDDRPRESGLANVMSLPEAIRKGLPLPILEPTEMRQARIDFLLGLGQLHERQSEIEDRALHLTSPNPDQPKPAVDAAVARALVQAQQSLQADYAKVTAQFAAGNLGQADAQRGGAIQQALDGAAARLDAAASDLRGPLTASTLQSQQQAVAGLATARDAFKSHDWAAKIGLFSILLIILWQSFAPRWFKAIPGPLVAVALATLLTWAISLPVLYVEVPDNLWQGVTFPALHVLEDVPLRELLIAGLMMAIIASAETLLCATAVDRMHTGPRANYDRELVAQGTGNFLCGLVGALPMTGVIVRSAANVQAGATTRWAAILHGLWLLLFVVLLGFALRMVPTAALAGVLVYMGFKLIDFKGFQSLWEYSRVEAGIFLATTTLIVVQDLLTGVVVGMVLSAVKLLVTFSRLDLRVTAGSADLGREILVIEMSGAATFLRLPQLAAALDKVPRGTELHIVIEKLDYVDHACLELLIHWERRHQAGGGRLVIDWDQLHARFKDLDAAGRIVSPATGTVPASSSKDDHARSSAA